MKRRAGTDYVLLSVVLALIGFGVVMVYSTTAILATDRFGDPYYFLKKQLVYAGIGLLLMVVMRFVKYEGWRKAAYPVLIISILSLVAVLIPGIGHRAGGSVRWIRIGSFGFQPSELAKLGLIIFLAYFLTKKEGKMQSFCFGFLPTIVLSGIVILLVLKEPDFGAALFLGSMVFLLLFVSGAKIIYIVGFLMIAAPVVYYSLTSATYRYRRLVGFLRPWDDPGGTSFQIVQSFLSFGSGGLFGVGLGEGRQKLFFLPAPHTDFIFSIIGEELGMVGAMVLVLLFVVFTLRGIMIAMSACDRYAAYLALGITLLISLQAVINMAVVLGLLPTKGLTLPFISYGGTSLITNLMGVGILLQISSRGENE